MFYNMLSDSGALGIEVEQNLQSTKRDPHAIGLPPWLHQNQTSKQTVVQKSCEVVDTAHSLHKLPIEDMARDWARRC